jgi:outer membrane cobalamin receptor
MNKRAFIASLILVTFLTPNGLLAQEREIVKINKYFSMDVLQLMNWEMTTAGKKKEKISDIPASVVLITRDEIETYGYQTLGEIMENIPGLYLVDDYLSQIAGIRGFWNLTPNRNVIILINGLPYRDELTGGHLMEHINVPVEAIDRIEVVRGPMSVLYGNGALYGVINIFTDQFEGDVSPSMVSASVGSENSQKAFVRASGKQEDFRYVFNGSYYQTDGPSIPLTDLGAGFGGHMDTGGKLERNEKFFNFSGVFKNVRLKASYSENHKESMVLYPSADEGTMVMYKDLRFSFGYNRELSDSFRLESELSWFVNSYSFDYDMMIVDDFYGIQENGASGFKVTVNAFYNPSEKLDFTMGVNYLHVHDINNDYTIPAFKLNLTSNILADGESIVTRSIFAQLNYRLSNKLKIVAGAMLEQMPAYTLESRIGNVDTFQANSHFAEFRQTRAEFIPRLAMIFAPNKRNIFKLLYGRAINRSSFFHNLDLLISPDLPHLNPETIDTLELNYIAQISSKVTVNISAFRNILDRLIYRTFYADETTAFFYHANVGEMVTNGVEVSAMISPSKKFYLELSGTCQDTMDKRPGFEDLDVAYSPKYLAYIKAYYFLSKNISMAMTGNYVGPMETYFDSTLVPPQRLGDRVDGYFLLGANVRVRHLFGTGMFLNLRVSNLLDQEIRFPATANNFMFAGKGTLGRKRSLLLTLGWKF